MQAHGPEAAGRLLNAVSPSVAFEALVQLNQGFVQDILATLEPELRQAILDAATPELARQWQRNQGFAPDTIGRMMEPAQSVLAPDMSVGEAIEALRKLLKNVMVTYGYVVDGAGKLLGLVTMRDLLFNSQEDAAHRHHAARCVRLPRQHGAIRCDAAHPGPPLSGVPGVR